jgi:hypothetical protein
MSEVVTQEPDTNELWHNLLKEALLLALLSNEIGQPL